MEKKAIITSSQNGLIGVDINPDNLAVTEIDAKGNFINSFVLPFDLKGNSQYQRQDIINNALILLKDHALQVWVAYQAGRSKLHQCDRQK